MEMFLVHSDPKGSHFERAARGEVAIFFDPEGGAPKGTMSEAEFLRRARYWVSPGNALRLQKLLEENTSPSSVIDQLRLFYRNPYTVRDEMNPSTPPSRPGPVSEPRNSVPLLRNSIPLAMLVPDEICECECERRRRNSSADDGGFIF